MRNVILVVGSLMVFSLVACKRDEADATPPKGPHTIVAAKGIADIHLGMTKEELLKLDPHAKVHPGVRTDNMQFQEAGIEVVLRKDVAVGIIFKYGQEQSFRGSTREGIGETSTIRDVICEYGQPEYIENMTRNDGKADGYQSVYLFYHDRGIVFTFADGKLETIRVFPPNELDEIFGPPDEGDTSQYRNIDCDE